MQAKLTEGFPIAIMPSMDHSFRYFVRLILGPLVMIVLAVGAIVWLSQSLRFVDLVLNRGLPVYYLFWMALLILPMILATLMPVALFVAVIFAYSKLNMDSELVVLRAAGMSDYGLCKPAFALTGIVMALCYAVNLYFMPIAYQEFKELQFSIRNDYSSVLLQEGVFNTMAPDITVYVAERTPDGELLGLLAHDTRDPDRPVTMIAERGEIVRGEDGQPRILMVNGNRQMIERNRNQLSLLYFDRYTLDLSTTKSDEGPRFREAQERFLDDLFSPGETPNDRANANRFHAEGHQRLASPFLALAYSLIALAAMLSGEFNRRGQSKRILIAVGVVVALQITDLGLINLAAVATMTVPLIYILPISVIACASWVLFRPVNSPSFPGATPAVAQG
jgi:lipopolysaccharide export system permease protein